MPKIKLAKYNWYKYPFTYKAWIDKMIADQVYEIWREAFEFGELPDDGDPNDFENRYWNE